MNDGEIDVVCTWLDRANARAIDASRTGVLVFVLTPYRAQLEMLDQRIGDGRRWPALRVEAKTVDAVQGQQAEYVIMTTARTHGNVNFVADKFRMNVALSRAEEGFVLVGHREGLARGENVFSQLSALCDGSVERLRIRRLEETWVSR